MTQDDEAGGTEHELVYGDDAIRTYDTEDEARTAAKKMRRRGGVPSAMLDVREAE